MFWHPRFQVDYSQDLVQFVMPFLPTLKERVQQLGTQAGTSMRGVVKALEFLAGVAIQDALVLCTMYGSHPVHIRLLSHTPFM